MKIEQLRGRELPGFMSSQAFYMCMSQYVDMWMDPGQQLIKDVQQVALDVSTQLADVLLSQYPGLKNALISVIEKLLADSASNAIDKLADCSNREKDPFTMNDFLQQWVNKIRFDRFSSAVDVVFDNTKNPASNWAGLKEEVYAGMRHWYRSTHSVSAMASAQDMSAIMEAYWHLAAKRYIDSCCMLTDSDVLGKLPSSLQDEMYQFIKDDSRLEVTNIFSFSLCQNMGVFIFQSFEMVYAILVVFR
jgi:interferon-induced GTP-binding protein Mx1